MKWTTGQKFLLLVVLVGNAIAWLIPSDVVELIARDRQTLLGRYSRTQMAWLLALLPISALVLHIALGTTVEVRKRRLFRAAAVLLVLVPTVFAVDVALRFKKDWGYVLDGIAYHRSPDRTLRGEFIDRPQAVRTYPNPAGGYERIEWTLTTDHRGFRNATTPEQCDNIALGDSFTEGSQVSDDQVWTTRFTEHAAAPMYNLGVSGYAPQNSAEALRKFGLPLKPQRVFFVLYEGNDFGQAKIQAKAPSEWGRFFKQSPLVDWLDQLLIDHLAPIGAHANVKGLEVVAWQPIAYPPGPDARYYAFPPSFLTNAYVTADEFAADKRTRNIGRLLEDMQSMCKQAGATLVVVFAPSKPHVVLPLVSDQLPAENVRAFTALRSNRKLPPPAEFLPRLLAGLDVPEAATVKCCAERNIPMISLTDAMRDAVRTGRQPYFSYNAHWTPQGHEIAGQVVADAVKGWAATDTTLPSDVHAAGASTQP
jgi:hypothetical protein